MDDGEVPTGPRPWAEALFAWMEQAREEFVACPAPLRRRIIDMARAANFNTRPCVPARPSVPAGDAEPSEASVADAAEIEADEVPETEGSDEGSADGDAEAPPAPEVWVWETPPLPEGDELGVPCSLGGRGADDAGETSDAGDASAAAEPQMAAPTAPAQAQAQAGAAESSAHGGSADGAAEIEEEEVPGEASQTVGRADDWEKSRTLAYHYLA